MLYGCWTRDYFNGTLYHCICIAMLFVFEDMEKFVLYWMENIEALLILLEFILIKGISLIYFSIVSEPQRTRQQYYTKPWNKGVGPLTEFHEWYLVHSVVFVQDIITQWHIGQLVRQVLFLVFQLRHQEWRDINRFSITNLFNFPIYYSKFVEYVNRNLWIMEHNLIRKYRNHIWSPLNPPFKLNLFTPTSLINFTMCARKLDCKSAHKSDYTAR